MGTLNTSSATTFQLTCELVDDFVAVRPIFANASTALSDKVVYVAASALSSAADLNNSSGTWVQGTGREGYVSFLTALAPATGRISFTVPDWIPLTSVARTDGGTNRLVAVRAYVSGNTLTQVVGTGSVPADALANWASRTDGNLVALRYQAADGVAAPTNFTSTTDRDQCAIVGVQYLSKSGKVTTVGGVGDSITEGRGTYLGDSHVFQAARDVAAATGRKIEYSNFGWSSETMTGSSGFAGRAIDILESPVCPDILVMPTGSPNDLVSPTQSYMDQYQLERNHVAMRANERRVVPVFWTFLPVNDSFRTWGTDDAFRVADNARALAQPGLIVADTSTVYSGATSGGQVQIASGLTTDGVHPNDTGNAALKVPLITVLKSALSYASIKQPPEILRPAQLPVYVSTQQSATMSGGGLWVYNNPTVDGSWNIAPRTPSGRAKFAQLFYVSVMDGSHALTISTVGSDVFKVGGVNTVALTLQPGDNAIIMNDGSSWRVFSIPAWAPNVHLKTASGAQTLDRTATLWVNTGAAATWTLPAVANNTGLDYRIVNRGSGPITLQRAGSDNIYNNGTQTSVAIPVSTVCHVVNDGTYWLANIEVDLAATQTPTGKTIDLASNTLTGTTAQFNTALSDDDFATLGGTQTFTGVKTLPTPVINGTPTGTGVATAATASTVALRDANANLTADAFIASETSTPTAAGTTTLTIADTKTQVFTGSTTQTVKLPTTSVIAGQSYTIVNQSSGAVSVQSSGANAIVTLNANKVGVFIAVVDTPTTAANWLSVAPTASGVASTLVLRDSNSNTFASNYLVLATSTVTAAGTTTLSLSSSANQVFTGSTTQTVKLPTTGITGGYQWNIINQSSGAVTGQSSGGNTIATVTGGNIGVFMCLNSTPTTAADWKTIFNA
jgi:lysophospholipase L1-like esterase